MWYIVFTTAGSRSTLGEQWRMETRHQDPSKEGHDGEVSCSIACVGESPPDPLGGHHSAGPWQRTGAVCERVPAHTDDTLREASTEVEN